MKWFIRDAVAESLAAFEAARQRDLDQHGVAWVWRPQDNLDIGQECYLLEPAKVLTVQYRDGKPPRVSYQKDGGMVPLKPGTVEKTVRL